MKRLFFKLSALLMVLVLCLPLPAAAAGESGCGCASGTEGAFTKGRGTEANPFRITTEAQLRHMEAHPDRHFRLDKDLKLSGEGWEPLCADAPFTGSLDGKRKSITGLTVTGGTLQGLFAQIGEGGYVHDLTLEGTVTAAEDTLALGAVAGENRGQLYLVTSEMVLVLPDTAPAEAAAGGLVGVNHGYISLCAFSGSLTDSRANSGSFTGAIVGRNEPNPPEGLPTMITAHAGFAAKGGSGDKREDNTIDNIIKSVCLSPDTVEVDIRLYTAPDGTAVPVLTHDEDLVGPECLTLEEVFSLLQGSHPRSGELTENRATISIQLDCKEAAAKKAVFDTIEACGFPLDRVIIPVGPPQTVASDLSFWQEKAAAGLQIWVEPDQQLYDDPQGYADSLDALGIQGLVVNMSYEKADRELAATLAQRGYGLSLWTLNTHSALDENMTIGAYNLTSRLEEALRIRDGYRQGLLDNSWTVSLPEAGGAAAVAGAPKPAPAARDPQNGYVIIAIAAVSLLAIGAVLFAVIKKNHKKKNKKNEK